MPTQIRSETVLNVVQRRIPFTAALLTQEEIKLIDEKGPYTEPFDNVFAILNPFTVRQQLQQGLDELSSLLIVADDSGALRLPFDNAFAILNPFTARQQLQQGLDELSSVLLVADDSGDDHVAVPRSEGEIIERLLGYPPIATGGPSQIDILPTIPKCDTKSHRDVMRFFPILLDAAMATCKCIIIFMDGQGVEILRACKARWPHDYKRILIGNGHFHAFSHFMFCLIEGFWKVSSRVCADTSSYLVASEESVLPCPFTTRSVEVLC